MSVYPLQSYKAISRFIVSLMNSHIRGLKPKPGADKPCNDLLEIECLELFSLPAMVGEGFGPQA